MDTNQAILQIQEQQKEIASRYNQLAVAAQQNPAATQYYAQQQQLYHAAYMHNQQLLQQHQQHMQQAQVLAQQQYFAQQHAGAAAAYGPENSNQGDSQRIQEDMDLLKVIQGDCKTNITYVCLLFEIKP